MNLDDRDPAGLPWSNIRRYCGAVTILAKRSVCAMQKINLAEAFDRIPDCWNPRIARQINDTRSSW